VQFTSFELKIVQPYGPVVMNKVVEVSGLYLQPKPLHISSERVSVAH